AEDTGTIVERRLSHSCCVSPYICPLPESIDQHRSQGDRECSSWSAAGTSDHSSLDSACLRSLELLPCAHHLHHHRYCGGSTPLGHSARPVFVDVHTGVRTQEMGFTDRSGSMAAHRAH